MFYVLEASGIIVFKNIGLLQYCGSCLTQPVSSFHLLARNLFWNVVPVETNIYTVGAMFLWPYSWFEMSLQHYKTLTFAAHENICCFAAVVYDSNIDFIPSFAEKYS